MKHAVREDDITRDIPLKVLASVLLALPWLNPFATGPSPAVAPWLFSLACSAACLVALAGATHARLARATAWAWLAAALISTGIGLLQYFGVSALFSPWVNVTGTGEAFANLRQRNQFATLTNTGLAALIWVAMHWQSQSKSGFAAAAPAGRAAALSMASVGPAVSAASLAAAALLAVGNAASSSRTGLVQLILLLVLFALWGGLRRAVVRRILFAAALAYVAGSVALPLLAGLDPASTGILARLHDGGPACGSRLILWRNVLHLITLRPWLGWGWGELDYAHFTTLYEGLRFCEILDNAHNLPLHLAVELGVPAALLVCGTGVWLAWRAKPWREQNAVRQMAWSVLAVILLHSLLEYPLWYGPFQMAFVLCLLLLRRRPPDAAHATMVEEKMPVKLAKYAWAATFLVAAGAFAAWDYHRISQIFLPPDSRSPAYRDNTLDKIRGSWLFSNQVRFAEFVTTPLTRDNAARVNAMAHQLLHYSPEARVAEKLIESAVMLGRDDEALLFLARYRAAFPAEHARWAKRQAPG